MQRDDWLTCTNPIALLDFLQMRTSNRKLRLFACACIRDVWHLLTDHRLREFVPLVESCADEATCQEALRAALPSIVNEAVFPAVPEETFVRAVAENTFVSRDEPSWYTSDTWRMSKIKDVARTVLPLLGNSEAEQFRQSAHLHCLFHWPVGYLFNYWPAIPADVLAWNDGTVRRIARAIFDERSFDNLPILADALEEAGYGGDHLIQHCRSAGPHVRGCWPVDLILGME